LGGLGKEKKQTKTTLLNTTSNKPDNQRVASPPHQIEGLGEGRGGRGGGTDASASRDAVRCGGDGVQGLGAAGSWRGGVRQSA